MLGLNIRFGGLLCERCFLYYDFSVDAIACIFCVIKDVPISLNLEILGHHDSHR